MQDERKDSGTNVVTEGGQESEKSGPTEGHQVKLRTPGLD